MASRFSGAPLAAVQRAILDWFARCGRDLPWRRTRDPYRILVAEMMLQQTQVDRVVPKYHEFLATFPTLADLAAAPLGDVIRVWAGLGYNRRAVNLQRAAQGAVARFGGHLPNDLAALGSLPGIGRYTAAAIACFAFEQPVPVVETNIRRVLRRVAGQPTLSERDAWALAAASLPEAAWAWNQALMDIGATLCTARAPRCLLCPAFAACATRGEGRAIAERRASYRVARFEGSNRWYRGRAVAALRALAPGESLSLTALGAAIKPDFGANDTEWIAALAARLAAEGLARLEGERISLP
jgi:A/G-specific adenine glycosylase